MIDDLLRSFDDMLKTDFVIRNPLISCGISEARSKLLEYYPIQDESIKRLEPLYLAMVLDPRFKLETFRGAGFSDNKVEMIKHHFYAVYPQYLVQSKNAVNKLPQQSTQTSSPGLGRFRFGSQTDVVHSEHEIERYLMEPIENPRQDPVAFHKTREASFPIISRIARDYFAASAMSAPAEALFSRMGDIISKKRNKLLPTTIRILAILKSRGIIREEEIPQDNADTEDDVDQPIELTDEQEDAGVEELLVVDDAEDDEVIVDTLTATQVFET
ncbi:hypothetical protein HF325_001647 [Metschnikowia pulcherrima]|uniref:HAT C-terminal dimerisation domain-containing protein n=1 Tax=Metschnikowia pulcherrima TaxID=27326 RepID=A0A8H7LD98_9ASCO|nr:hypothetical protein HF325_001647 [Metschnikowia pulcherrima]